MKKVVLFFMALILGASGALATATSAKVSNIRAYHYNDSFIFVENGITFSVYPDGEFDFSIDRYVSGQRNGVTFNSGYDYSPYTQYDDYGAVVQVENIPIYYDYYGRVSQIGDININYQRNRVNRVGNMNVYYNRRGLYDYHTGFINVYNRNYVFRPFHAFFARPVIGSCLVYNRPYRRYYNPVRYTYYNPYRYNTRRAYTTVGQTHRYNKVRNERAKVYRNDRRVAVMDNAVRTNRSVSNRNSSTNRSNRSVTNRSTLARTSRSQSTNRTAVTRSSASRDRSATSQQSTSARNPKRTVVTKSRVTSTPSNRTVTRNTQITRRSQPTTTNRSVRQATSRKNMVGLRNTSSRNISQASSRSRINAASRSSSPRSVSRAPTRITRSVSSRSTSSRNTTSRTSSGGRRSSATRSVALRSPRRH